MSGANPAWSEVPWYIGQSVPVDPLLPADDAAVDDGALDDGGADEDCGTDCVERGSAPCPMLVHTETAHTATAIPTAAKPHTVHPSPDGGPGRRGPGRRPVVRNLEPSNTVPQDERLQPHDAGMPTTAHRFYSGRPAILPWYGPPLAGRDSNSDRRPGTDCRLKAPPAVARSHSGPNERSRARRHDRLERCSFGSRGALIHTARLARREPPRRRPGALPARCESLVGPAFRHAESALALAIRRSGHEPSVIISIAH
jgi:hypothetical protein